MRLKSFVFPLVALFVLFFIFELASAPASTMTVQLNSSTVWWRDGVRVNGSVWNSTNEPMISGELTVTINNKLYCSSTTDSTGNYTCNFTAPDELGTYAVWVNATKGSEMVINSTTLTVKVTYGETPVGHADRVVYEVPVLIQEVSGKIRSALAKIVVWSGS